MLLLFLVVVVAVAIYGLSSQQPGTETANCEKKTFVGKFDNHLAITPSVTFEMNIWLVRLATKTVCPLKNNTNNLDNSRNKVEIYFTYLETPLAKFFQSKIISSYGFNNMI